MKQILKWVMVAMMLAASACTKTETPKDDPKEVELLPFEKQIQKAGTLVVGTSPDYAPFESLTPDGKLEGFDIDLMHALANEIKRADGTVYQIEWVQMSFDTIVTAVQTGQVDLGISSFTYDKDRDVLFSTPYIESQQVVLVKKDSSIKTLADLEGKKIGVQLGSTGEGAAKDIANASLMSLNNVNVLMESLKTNAVDAVVVDKGVGDNYVANAGFVKLEEPLIDENVSIIAKKGNQDLMDLINKSVEAYKQTDAYQASLEKWGLHE